MGINFDNGWIPSAAKTTGTALGLGRANDRWAGAPAWRMTALLSKNQAECFAVHGRCLVMY